jgi:integrase
MSLRARHGQWHYRFKVHRKTYSGSTGFEDTRQNRNIAEAFERRHKREVLDSLLAARKSSGAAQSPGILDFATAAGAFIRWCEQVRYREHPSSGARIRSSFGSLVHYFGDKPISAVTAGEIESYKGWRFENNIADVSVRHDLHALSTFFQYAKKKGWAHGNPVREVDIPSDRDAVRENILSPEQEQKYFAGAEKHLDRFGRKALYDFGRIMIQQGCRPEEVLSLRKDDFDVEEKTVKIRKGKTPAAQRVLALTQESANILQARMGVEGIWFFPSDRKRGHHLVSLRRVHARVLEETGLIFDCYDLRHTFATRMATNPAINTDLPTLAKILGHANLRTVQRYLHPTSESVRNAMARYEAAMVRTRLRKVAK